MNHNLFQKNKIKKTNTNFNITNFIFLNTNIIIY
jgi:hypothetical protein